MCFPHLKGAVADDGKVQAAARQRCGTIMVVGWAKKLVVEGQPEGRMEFAIEDAEPGQDEGAEDASL